jgi:hypothetical protein
MKEARHRRPVTRTTERMDSSTYRCEQVSQSGIRWLIVKLTEEGMMTSMMRAGRRMFADNT